MRRWKEVAEFGHPHPHSHSSPFFNLFFSFHLLNSQESPQSTKASRNLAMGPSPLGGPPDLSALHKTSLKSLATRQ